MTTIREPTGFTAWRHQIPTHLDVEDRLLFGLPARRVLTLLCGLAFAYTLWHQWLSFPLPGRAALGVGCIVIAVTLAFVRPAGLGLESWGLLLVRHATRPRASVWRPAGTERAAGSPASEVGATSGWHDLVPRLDWAQGAPKVRAADGIGARGAQSWPS